MGSKNRAVLQLNPKDRLRIVVACHAWYDDLIGGSFRLASEFAVWLAEQGHDVSYVCCQVDPNRELTSFEKKVHVLRYPAPSVTSGRLVRMRHHVQETKRLVSAVARQGPIDAVSSHSPLQGLGAGKAVRRKSAVVNFTVHSPFDDELSSNVPSNQRGALRTRLARWAARWVDRQSIRSAHIVQTLSRYTLQNLTEKHGPPVSDRGAIEPGWVEADQFQPVEDRQAARRALGGVWEFDGPLFFTLRRLENRMGLETLVEACAVLKSEGLNFRTLIGGGGSLRETLQQQIDDAGLQDSVFLLGRLPEEQLAISYAAADCFVLPTRALECFGLIVLEAFACDTPVIASSAAAIPELAAQQGDDWMFEPGNSPQLADRMKRFLLGELKQNLSLREFALRYDRPVVQQRWERLLLSKVRSG
ncbi:MAG: glycosyltransferase family 4 protein [Fuerstiella sp.]